MALLTEITAAEDDMIAWRRHIHAHPETAFEEVNTSDYVAVLLESFGLEVHRGLARTGVVGVLHGTQGSGKCIGLRADMDALDMQEDNQFPHASRTPGKMHACGHDGHTAMLLGAARVLAASRDFAGTINFIFQPAEENVGGGKAMMADGLFEQFPCDAIFGLHNWPPLSAGRIGLRPGPMMAAADLFFITVHGKGGHAAAPHRTTDPIVTAAAIISSLQSITSRSIDPIESAVVSVTRIMGGSTTNVIPDSVEFCGTARSFTSEVRDIVERRIGEVAANIATAHGARVDYRFERGYPPLVNDAEATTLAASAARAVVGEENVDVSYPPFMGGEDFSFMLQEVPGCYLFLGQGAGEAPMVHNSRYDFNDAVLTTGASYFVEVARTALAAA